MGRMLIDKDYNEKMLPTGLVVFEVYDENYVGNDEAQKIFDDYCAAHNCGGFLAMAHRYGEIDKETGTRPEIKTHRHGAIWQVNQTRKLNKEQIDRLLNSICPNFPAYICDTNNADTRKALALYSCHLTASSSLKEQFDIRKVYDEEGVKQVEINENGMTEVMLDKPLQTGAMSEFRTNIYDDKYGYIDFGTCCYENLIRKTIRERAREIAEERENGLNTILTHIYTDKVHNFTDLMKWAMDNSLTEVVAAYSSMLRNILTDMRHSAHNTGKNDIEVQNELTSIIINECYCNFVDVMRKANDLDKENGCTAYTQNVMKNTAYYKTMCNEMLESVSYKQTAQEDDEVREHIELSKKEDKETYLNQLKQQEKAKKNAITQAYNKAKSNEYAVNSLCLMLTQYGRVADLDCVREYLTNPEIEQYVLDVSNSCDYSEMAACCDEYISYAMLKEGVVF